MSIGKDYKLIIEKNKGITHALKKLIKKMPNSIISDGKITLSEWNATMDKLVEINEKRKQAGKESIFTGGVDKTKKGWRNSFIVHSKQEITFTEEEINELFAAMGVTISETQLKPESPKEKTKEEQPIEEADTTKVAPPKVKTPKEKADSTKVAPPKVEPPKEKADSAKVAPPKVKTPKEEADTTKVVPPKVEAPKEKADTTKVAPPKVKTPKEKADTTKVAPPKVKTPKEKADSTKVAPPKVEAPKEKADSAKVAEKKDDEKTKKAKKSTRLSWSEIGKIAWKSTKKFVKGMFCDEEGKFSLARTATTVGVIVGCAVLAPIVASAAATGLVAAGMAATTAATVANVAVGTAMLAPIAISGGKKAVEGSIDYYNAETKEDAVAAM